MADSLSIFALYLSGDVQREAELSSAGVLHPARACAPVRARSLGNNLGTVRVIHYRLENAEVRASAFLSPFISGVATGAYNTRSRPFPLAPEEAMSEALPV